MTASHQIERKREAGEASPHDHQRIALRPRNLVEVSGSCKRITRQFEHCQAAASALGGVW
jgi:hypothetical protein